MADLRWSWLATPYVVCTALILAVTIAAALIRGDRVMRIGVIAAAATAVPWAFCQALAACTDDPVIAGKLLRLGQGPVAGVGPSLMLVLLGVSGQLERYRWVARLAGLIGLASFIVCWSTSWVVPGAQRTPSGMFYISPGPLTGLHVSQLVVWLLVGLYIARRSAPRGERKRTLRLMVLVLVFAAIGSIDTLLLYRIWGVYPIAWLPASIAAGLALYGVFRTDLLRPQGFDRGTATELVMFLGVVAATAAIALVLGTSSVLPLATLAAVIWVTASGVAWAIAKARPVRVKGERELEQFVARVATFDDESQIEERLATLWEKAVDLTLRKLWWADGKALTDHGDTIWLLDPEARDWLIQHNEPVNLSDLGTMRLGALRAKIESLVHAHGAGIVVPLVDRDELVGLVEVDDDRALREAERGLIAESARAAARALTFVSLARTASRERETERQVEVADAMRLQASASREAELGRWAVAAEYRTAPRSTGAGWSAIELADGRLALLVTEAQAHGVAAALATAALTGAFAAATSGTEKITLEDLLSTMRASSEGVLRGGEPVAAFLAILDAQAQTIEWACAGHPGALLIGPIAMVEAGLPLGSAKEPRAKATLLTGGRRIEGASLTEAKRGTTRLPPDTLLVVASTALRGDDDSRWETTVRAAAPASGRLAAVLVEQALVAGEPIEDLLAVVVRAR